MNVYRYPWKLVPNKIVRYPGGRELDRFRGIFPGADDNRPEAWIGSDTRTINAVEKGDPNDGCSECILPDGRRCYLFEAIEADPEQALGDIHIAQHGSRVGLLVKLLDAELQLGLQTHPTRPYAREHFNSEYGKEESWYVIGVRDDSAQPPYVLLGFKEDAAREQFEAAYDAGDIAAMENCCHKIPVEVGDAFYIAAGAPHAIGCGCFIVEVQEPSDITVGARKIKHAAAEEQEQHKQRLLGCYIYNGSSYEENLRRYRIKPQLIRSGGWGREQIIIGQGTAEYFSFTRLDTTASVPVTRTGALQTVIVLGGEGQLTCADQVMSIRQGDELFIPYEAEDISVEPKDGSTLSLILCHPAHVRHQVRGDHHD